MSITMIMEIGSEASEAGIVSAIAGLATVKPSGENAYDGNFHRSNMYFSIELRPKNDTVMAENVAELQNVKVGARIFYFIVPAHYQLCIDQIVAAATRIARTQARFVLSKSYETVFAVGDNGSINYRQDFYRRPPA